MDKHDQNFAWQLAEVTNFYSKLKDPDNISNAKWFGVVVIMLGTSTMLLYAKPGHYWDGWLFTSILSWYVHIHPDQLSLLPHWDGKWVLAKVCPWHSKTGE